MSGQRNGHSPRSSHFRRKVILNTACKLQNNCSSLLRKQDPSSDHTGKAPSKDQNGNCRRTGGIPTRKGDRRPNHESQNTVAQGTQAPTTLYMCFVDFKKEFDSISHDKFWVTVMDMGYPLHLIDMLAKLYRKQLVKVKVAKTLSEWFRVDKGVQQGCVLSPHLFNILAETVTRETLDGFQGGLQIGGRIIMNCWYADDIILLATLKAELQELVDRLDRVSRKYSLLINVDKTKVMASDSRVCRIFIQNSVMLQLIRITFT